MNHMLKGAWSKVVDITYRKFWWNCDICCSPSFIRTMETENSSPLALQSRLFHFLWSIVTILWAAEGHHYWPHAANIPWDICSTHSWILLRKIWSNVLSTTVWASLEGACYFWDMARESRQKGKVLLNCSENIQYPACIFKLCKWFWSSSEEPSQKLFISLWLGFDSLTVCCFMDVYCDAFQGLSISYSFVSYWKARFHL